MSPPSSRNLDGFIDLVGFTIDIARYLTLSNENITKIWQFFCHEYIYDYVHWIIYNIGTYAIPTVLFFLYIFVCFSSAFSLVHVYPPATQAFHLAGEQTECFVY